MEDVYVDVPQMENEALNLKVTSDMQANLLSGAKWLKFLTVVATVGVVLLLLLSIGCFGLAVAGTTVGEYTPGLLFCVGCVYLVCVGLYVYPIKKVFSLVKNIREAMNDCSQVGFEDAADDFRSILKYCGIVTIIALGIYALMLIFILLMVLFAAALA